MERCDYQNPCPICKRYSDGCLYAKDGTAAICVRVVEGSVKVAGQAGYLHIIKEGFKPKPVVKKRPATINWSTLQKCYSDGFNKQLEIYHCPLLPSFQVSKLVLHQIETGFDGEAFTFPVRNAEDEIIGISRRFPDGSKGMVKDSQVGIFIPRLNWDKLDILFICEGASDTATALDMGLKAIGRVSCQTGRDHIIKFCAKKKPSQIVIISDSDIPGLAGAKILGKHLCHGYKLFTIPFPSLKIITPPTGVKDIREWREKGLTLEELMIIVKKELTF